MQRQEQTEPKLENEAYSHEVYQCLVHKKHYNKAQSVENQEQNRKLPQLIVKSPLSNRIRLKLALNPWLILITILNSILQNRIYPHSPVTNIFYCSIPYRIQVGLKP